MFFLGGIVFGLIFRYFGINPEEFDAADNNYVQCLIELVYGLIIFLLYQKTFKNDTKDFKSDKSKYLNTFFRYLALFFAVKIASALVTSFIDLVFGMELTESENQTAIIEMAKSAPIVMLISTAILAPLVEEGIFRLSLRKIINNKKVFIIVSGVVFGFMHIFPTELAMSVALTYSITYVTMGIFLAYAYAETDNIWIPILLHAANNLFSMIAIFFLS